MESKAIGKYFRIAPAKARKVVDLIRRKPVEEALAILKLSPKKAARMVYKVLHSAVANALQQNKAEAKNLMVEQVFVDEGPTMKRFSARAMGRATRIRKRSSTISIHLKN
jgi:large subunit ribosomal protein L22